MSKGTWPEDLIVDSGNGAVLWDVDGQQWLDWTASLGPVILGYNNQTVNEAIVDQLERGIVFPSAHPLEAEVAERVIDLCPGVEAVRLGKTGSDAVAAAVRAARAYTGRQLVLADSTYHGWHDWQACRLPYSAGVIDAQEEWNWTWNGKLGFWLHEAAALVLCPENYDRTQLEEILDYCAYHGTLVIFDEVISGFRMAPGGAREFYGVQPDLSCYGKAMANGMPVSAVGGSRDVMAVFDPGMWSTTHAGETLSLAAAKATLDIIGDGTVLKAINRRGERIAEALDISYRYGAHLHLDLSEVQVGQLMGRGILTNGDLFGMAAHTEDQALYTVQSIKDVLMVTEP